MRADYPACLGRASYRARDKHALFGIGVVAEACGKNADGCQVSLRILPAVINRT
jgi:hypothetical protein